MYGSVQERMQGKIRVRYPFSWCSIRFALDRPAWQIMCPSVYCVRAGRTLAVECGVRGSGTSDPGRHGDTDRHAGVVADRDEVHPEDYVSLLEQRRDLPWPQTGSLCMWPSLGEGWHSRILAEVDGTRFHCSALAVSPKRDPRAPAKQPAQGPPFQYAKCGCPGSQCASPPRDPLLTRRRSSHPRGRSPRGSQRPVVGLKSRVCRMDRPSI